MMVIPFFLLVLITLLYVFRPLLGESYWPFFGKGEFAELHEDKREGIWAISDLDFEYEAGKLTRDDYLSTREYLKGDVIPVLERERALSGKTASRPERAISEGLKKDIILEVSRICGKRLSS